MRNKSNIQIENEWAENRKSILDKKWQNYISTLSTENFNRDEACQLMHDLNEFAYKMIVINRRDLL